MISFGSLPIVGGGELFPKYEFGYSESCDRAGSRGSFRGQFGGQNAAGEGSSGSAAACVG
jgi:hypothetical protein